MSPLSHEADSGSSLDPIVAVILADRAINAGLGVLSGAARYAADAERDRWDFAIELSRFRDLDICDSALRWMAHKGLVALADEITDLQDADRRFAHKRAPMFTDKTCFVLTDKGIAIASSLTHATGVSDVSEVESLHDSAPDVPSWDPLLRELWVGAQLVKRFTVPAPNQECILSAFMEDKWSYRIDDPLPPVDGMEPKRRLQAAIMCLNRNQRIKVIRFRGNGKGDGIRWELRSELATTLHPVNTSISRLTQPTDTGSSRAAHDRP